MATRNITLPSTNNLTLDPTKNIVLEPLVVHRAMHGQSRVHNTATRSQKGRSNVLSFYPKNLVVPSGNLWLSSGNNVVLQQLPVFRSSRGYSRINNTQIRIQTGNSRIFKGLERASQGYSRVGYERIATMAHQGQARVYRGTTAVQKGLAFVRGIFTPVKVGKCLIYENYKPITRRGRSFVFAAWDAKKKGRSRVENDAVEGFVVYVGYGQMPDFTQNPDGFSPTRPVVFDIVSPFSGIYDLYVVMRLRNKQGLESPHSKPEIITINSNGNEVLASISAPVLTDAVTSEEEYFRLFMRYPGIETDANPADEYRVYVGEGVVPVPGVDTPVATNPVSLDASLLIGPYPTGGITYYFAVTVFRNEDSEESDAATGSIVLGDDPLTPVAVKGGFEVRD